MVDRIRHRRCCRHCQWHFGNCVWSRRGSSGNSRGYSRFCDRLCRALGASPPKLPKADWCPPRIAGARCRNRNPCRNGRRISASGTAPIPGVHFNDWRPIGLALRAKQGRDLAPVRDRFGSVAAVLQGVPISLRCRPAMGLRACGTGRSASPEIGTKPRALSARGIAGCGAWAICFGWG